MWITDYLSKCVDKYNNRKGQLTSEYYENLLPNIPLEQKISKNLFQICLLGKVGESAEKTMSLLPSAFIENIEKLKKNNPEYRYHLYGDQEAELFIAKYYGPDILDYYHRIDNDYLAAKADFLRYLLLYALGGVYLDLKSTIDRPLSQTLQKEDCFLVFYWDNLPGGQHHYLIPDYITKGEMLQTFIISARGHFFLRKVILNVLRQIDLYNPYKNGVSWEGTLSTVGPVIYTKTIYDLIDHCTDNSIYREGKPWGEFGFKFYFAGEYMPGVYQKVLSMKDYRKSTRPLIVCSRKHLQKANILWLKILHLYRNLKNKNTR